VSAGVNSAAGSNPALPAIKVCIIAGFFVSAVGIFNRFSCFLPVRVHHFLISSIFQASFTRTTTTYAPSDFFSLPGSGSASWTDTFQICSLAVCLTLADGMTSVEVTVLASSNRFHKLADPDLINRQPPSVLVGQKRLSQASFPSW
jgi:hypothetical protein